MKIITSNLSFTEKKNTLTKRRDQWPRGIKGLNITKKVMKIVFVLTVAMTSHISIIKKTH